MKQSKSIFQHPLLMIIACSSLLFACKKDGNSNVLNGCCDTPAINATVGLGHVYVPNVFTPNGDGINDRLVVNGDQNIILIRSFRVSDKEGTTVFYAEDLIPNDPTNAWDGTVNAKYKNGVYSVIKDSIYIGYEKGNTFFVPW